ncbi:hypothetical protein SP15_095 [Bacillus phage SP-15]|uniref:Uncharacterized protein n=1 Tax=Bacillus phage SP-15 TaxID=1792032 RepID=A0A127AXB6_9CAUD|nr:hypothetical protein SP15_095 [Bacillus phage SP-15]AMM44894.1 hypothetical protein SP15_095 [Bacillus phage SP-15]
MGLKHDIHLQLQFQASKSSYDSDGREIKQSSKIDIGKSKISPKFKDISMTIDNTTGGTIDRLRSFMNYIRDYTKILEDNRGWIQLNPEFFQEGSHYLEYEPIIDKSSKKWRWDELVDAVKADPNWTRFLQMLMVDEIAKHYKYYHDISRDYRKNLYLHLQETIITHGVTKELNEQFGVDSHLELTDDQIAQLTEYQAKVVNYMSGDQDLEVIEELVHEKLDKEMAELEAEREAIAEEAQKSGDEELDHVDSEKMEYAESYDDTPMDDSEE